MDFLINVLESTLGRELTMLIGEYCTSIEVSLMFPLTYPRMLERRSTNQSDDGVAAFILIHRTLPSPLPPYSFTAFEYVRHLRIIYDTNIERRHTYLGYEIKRDPGFATALLSQIPPDHPHFDRIVVHLIKHEVCIKHIDPYVQRRIIRLGVTAAISSTHVKSLIRQCGEDTIVSTLHDLLGEVQTPYYLAMFNQSWPSCLQTFLMPAIRRNYKSWVVSLIQFNVDVNRSDEETPLICAIKHSHTRIMRMLVEARADPNLCDRSGTPPLIHAVNTGDLNKVRCLIDAGSDVTLIKSVVNPLLLTLLEATYEVVCNGDVILTTPSRKYVESIIKQYRETLSCTDTIRLFRRSGSGCAPLLSTRGKH